MHGSEFCGVVRGIKQAGALEALVWDGAPGHRDARVSRIDLPLIDLPPYSPELNPAEWLFEAIRAEIEGEVYTDLAAKSARWDADPDQVRSITIWSWLLSALDHLPVQTTA